MLVAKTMPSKQTREWKLKLVADAFKIPISWSRTSSRFVLRPFVSEELSPSLS